MFGGGKSKATVPLLSQPSTSDQDNQDNEDNSHDEDATSDSETSAQTAEP